MKKLASRLDMQDCTAAAALLTPRGKTARSAGKAGSGVLPRGCGGDPGLSPPGAAAAEPGQGRGLRAGLRAGSYLRCGGAR